VIDTIFAISVRLLFGIGFSWSGQSQLTPSSFYTLNFTSPGLGEGIIFARAVLNDRGHSPLRPDSPPYNCERIG